MKNKPRIRVALGGGGSRGIAHIGALEVLEQYFEIVGIAGTSIGAIIGGLYAAGHSPAKLRDIALSLRFSQFLPLFTPRPKTHALSNGSGFEGYLRELAEGTRIEHCHIPFIAVAYDLTSRRTVLLERGDLGMAMRASSSLPMVFFPIEDEQRVLVDGGIEHPLPLRFLDELPEAELSVAVNVLAPVNLEPLHSRLEPWDRLPRRHKTTLEIGIESVRCNQGFLASSAIAEYRPEIVIQASIDPLRLIDLLKTEEFYRLGVEKAKEAVEAYFQEQSEDRREE